MRFIDTHVHFYDPGRPEGILWPPNASQAALPEQLVTELGDSAPDKIVVIETSKRESDDQWLLELAASNPIIAGVILNLQIEQVGFRKRLEQACLHSKFRGIRLRPIREIDLRAPRLRRCLSELANSANIIEAGCPTPELLHQFLDLASQLPNQQFVLDHIGHPVISEDGIDKRWASSMQAAAQHANLSVKLTGLIQFSTSQNTKCEHYAATLDVLLHSFGPKRILFGSNWPLVKQSGGYQTNKHLISEHFSKHTQADVYTLKQILFSNAQRIYGI